MHKVIGIAAGKGGVGKSTLTVNLALALSALGYKVGVIDADLYGPSLGTMLPITERPGSRGERLIPAKSGEISVMTLAYFKKQDQASVIRAPIANRLIAQFLNQVEWGELDYLLIDFPPGTGDIQITLSQQSLLSGALIVTTPQEIALQDVRKCMDMFFQVQVPLIGIVENMSYFQLGEDIIYPFGKGGGEKLSADSQVPLLSQIPLDPIIGKCLDEGKSLFEVADAIGLKECFLHLAKEVHLFDSKNTLSVCSIEHNGSNLRMKWADGEVSQLSFYQLQEKCPCARCKEQKPKIDENVRAMQVKSVGRYAIQVAFSSGCSYGIYDFDLLKGLKI